jgi:hypothetical protein
MFICKHLNLVRDDYAAKYNAGQYTIVRIRPRIRPRLCIDACGLFVPVAIMLKDRVLSADIPMERISTGFFAQSFF